MRVNKTLKKVSVNPEKVRIEKAFYPQNIEKLFSVFMRNNSISKPRDCGFRLSKARDNYVY